MRRKKTMSKEKEQTNEQVAITPGEPIYVEGASRQEVKAKLDELKEKAAKDNLTWEGGFILYLPGEDGVADKFKGKITFKKL